MERDRSWEQWVLIRDRASVRIAYALSGLRALLQRVGTKLETFPLLTSGSRSQALPVASKIVVAEASQSSNGVQTNGNHSLEELQNPQRDMIQGKTLRRFPDEWRVCANCHKKVLFEEWNLVRRGEVFRHKEGIKAGTPIKMGNFILPQVDPPKDPRTEMQSTALYNQFGEQVMIVECRECLKLPDYQSFTYERAMEFYAQGRCSRFLGRRSFQRSLQAR